MTTRTITITFPAKEESFIITAAEHDLIVSHPSRDAGAEFLSRQYALSMSKARAILNAANAANATRLSERMTEVRFLGEECTLEITQAEFCVINELTPIQAAKFLRDQYSLGLTEAKRCVDAARAMRAQTKNM